MQPVIYLQIYIVFHIYALWRSHHQCIITRTVNSNRSPSWNSYRQNKVQDPLCTRFGHNEVLSQVISFPSSHHSFPWEMRGVCDIFDVSPRTQICSKDMLFFSASETLTRGQSSDIIFTPLSWQQTEKKVLYETKKLHVHADDHNTYSRARGYQFGSIISAFVRACLAESSREEENEAFLLYL